MNSGDCRLKHGSSEPLYIFTWTKIFLSLWDICSQIRFMPGKFKQRSPLQQIPCLRKDCSEAIPAVKMTSLRLRIHPKLVESDWNVRARYLNLNDFPFWEVWLTVCQMADLIHLLWDIIPAHCSLLVEWLCVCHFNYACWLMTVAFCYVVNLEESRLSEWFNESSWRQICKRKLQAGNFPWTSSPSNFLADPEWLWTALESRSHQNFAPVPLWRW